MAPVVLIQRVAEEKERESEKEEAGLAFGKNTVDWKAKAKGNEERTYEWQIHFQNTARWFGR